MKNIESKHQLAKLLASEDITVRHSMGTQTASFDVKNRVLTLPNWILDKTETEIAEVVLDLLVGHEVGHALWTKPEDWKDALDAHFHPNALNIVEDARIEKKIKRKFPGLVKPMISGYKALDKKGFFGQQDNMKLLDRINLHFKLGPLAGIPFTGEDEWDIVRMVEKIESWDDVLEATRLLMEASLMEDENAMEEMECDIKMDGDFPDVEGEMERQIKEMTNEEMKEMLDEQLGETQQEFDKNIQSKLTEEGTNYSSEITYYTIPEPILKNIVIPFKRLIPEMEAYVESQKGIDRMNDSGRWERGEDDASFELRTFKRKSAKIISYMAKEFERKKSASEYRKESISKSGMLDVTKLHKYKFEDDLFKRNIIRPDGKNHGMIMLVDWSASMHGHLLPTIKQILNLVWFCRKVNIPFEVYAFTGHYTDYSSRDDMRKFIRAGMRKRFGPRYETHPRDYDNSPGGMVLKRDLRDEWKKKGERDNWKVKVGSAKFDRSDDFHLLELFSSKMNNSMMTRATKMIYLLAATSRLLDWNRFDLGNTPTLPALCAMTKVIPEFQKKYNLDKTSLILLTDGDGNHSFSSIYEGDDSEYPNHGRYQRFMGDLRLEDPLTKKVYRLKDYSLYWSRTQEDSEKAVMALLMDRYGIKNIGIFVDGQRRGVSTGIIEKHIGQKRYNEKEFDALRKSFRKNGFMTLPDPGYTEYHIVPAGNLKEGVTDLEDIKEEMTVSKMKNVFVKAQNNKVGNKILINRLMEKIA